MLIEGLVGNPALLHSYFLGQGLLLAQCLSNAQQLEPLSLRGTQGTTSLPPLLNPTQPLTWLLLGSLLDLDSLQLCQAGWLCGERSGF